MELLREEFFDRNLQNYTAEPGADDTDPMFFDFKSSGFLYLFVLLLITIGFSLFKLCFFDIPRDTRNTQTRDRRRKKLIESRIISKTVIKKSKGQNGIIADDDDAKNPYQRQKSDLWLPFTEDDGDKDDDDGERSKEFKCPVCWEEYVENDKICWSQNPQCNHTFHIECIQPWLMQHDQCPLCRNNYLASPSETIHEDNPELPASAASHHSRGIQGGLPINVNVAVRSSLVDMLREMCRISDVTGNNSSERVADLNSSGGATDICDTEYGVQESPPIESSSDNDIESGSPIVEEMESTSSSPGDEENSKERHAALD